MQKQKGLLHITVTSEEDKETLREKLSTRAFSKQNG